MAEAAAIELGAEEEYVERIDPILRAPDLYQAAKDNTTETVLELIREEVPPFYFDKKSNLTALHWASIHGNAKVVKKLLEAGAHQKYLNQKQRIELESRGGLDAVSMDERAAMEEMLELEREHIEVDYFMNTPLLWAASKGHLEVVWQLLKYGYSPNDTDNLGNTALHVAAASGYKKIVQTLVDDGAMPTVVNQYKNPPLHLAKGKEIAELLEWAVEKGASMTQEDIKFKHGNISDYVVFISPFSINVKFFFFFSSLSLSLSLTHTHSHTLYLSIYLSIYLFSQRRICVNLERWRQIFQLLFKRREKLKAPAPPNPSLVQISAILFKDCRVH
jgi:hypothetical protein